jgi:hypothetical protein
MTMLGANTFKQYSTGSEEHLPVKEMMVKEILKISKLIPMFYF